MDKLTLSIGEVADFESYVKCGCDIVRWKTEQAQNERKGRSSR